MTYDYLQECKNDEAKDAYMDGKEIKPCSDMQNYRYWLQGAQAKRQELIEDLMKYDSKEIRYLIEKLVNASPQLAMRMRDELITQLEEYETILEELKQDVKKKEEFKQQYIDECIKKVTGQ